MRKLSSFIITLAVLMLPACSMFASTPQNNFESLKGSWTGELEVGPGKMLDVAVDLTTEDNNPKAVFKIIGQGDLPADSVSVADDVLFLKVNAVQFTLKGKIDRANNTMNCEFIQGDNRIPLVLKREDKNSENKTE